MKDRPSEVVMSQGKSVETGRENLGKNGDWRKVSK